jgi:hypothetical protein
VELTQKEAQRISGEIMEKVEKDLGSWVNNRLPLKYDPITYGGIMVLLDTVLQRITFFGGLYYYIAWDLHKIHKLQEVSLSLIPKL